MYEWFSRLSLPFPPLITQWTNGTALPPVLQRCGFELPIFVKACHITQGNLHSTRRVRSCDELRSDEYRSWFEQTWLTRPVDTGRVWQIYGDEITLSMTRRGFFVQSSAPGVNNSSQLAEIKTDVLWGRAYLGNAKESPCNGGNSDFILMRGASDDDAVTRSAECAWLVEEGHMACVWRLAERVARLAAVDSLRVDVFAVRGRPSSCMLNEISLSSAMPVGGHAFFMGSLWAEPHVSPLYRSVGNASSAAVYERGWYP